MLLMRAFIAYAYTDTLPAANQAIFFSTDARRTQRFNSTYSATKLLMHSVSLNTNMGCFQQTCLSPHCWHRVVKSCLHGTLRSKKTDKLVSKRTTKSWIKDLLCRDFCWLRNRNISFKFGDWMRNHFSQCISFLREWACLSCRVPSSSFPSSHLTACFGFISPLLTFYWRRSNTNCRQQVQKSATRQHQVQAKRSDRRSRRENPEAIQVSVAPRVCWCWLYQREKVHPSNSPALFPMYSEHKSAA